MRIFFFTLLILVLALPPAWAQDKDWDKDQSLVVDQVHDQGYDEEDDQDMGDLFEDYTQADEEKSVPDPILGFNKLMYRFNDKAYFWVFKPVAKGYGRVVPQPVRVGIDNMFYNLMFPVRFVNSLFQGKLKGAGSELGIFTVNSTLGLLGFFPVAQDHFNLKNSKEDLGQTFGVCRIKEGFYIVLPILGPTTLRDLVGDVGDWFITPLSYVTPYEASLGLKAFESVNGLSLRLGFYESFNEAAVDPYIAMKNAYIQSRRQKISQ
ncbi:MAG: VacJ family lipoprotein [Desulfobacterium sp.]|jgi:phospholipid-binding lipoprotein MlaA|nr:VacJ family lipoprotein [Desulfobacterium sp.]